MRARARRINNLRSRPRLVAAAQRRDKALGEGAASLLRRLVLGETALLAGAVVAAAILTSIAPPSARARRAARPTPRSARAPSPAFTRNGVRIQVGIQPNRAPSTTPSRCASRRRQARAQRAVTAELDMLDMSMQQQAYTLAEVSPGVYERSRPALVMVGHWLLDYTIEIPGHKAIKLQVVDKADG